MSDFFQASPVRAAMAEIQELQEDIMTGIAVRGMRNPSTEEGYLYISKMKKLLEKQKNFMFRLSLEKDDPDAIEMKENILESIPALTNALHKELLKLAIPPLNGKAGPIIIFLDLITYIYFLINMIKITIFCLSRNHFSNKTNQK